MTIPLLLLAIPSVIAGYWTEFFSYLNADAKPLDIAQLLSLPDTWIGVAVSLAGFIVAYAMYARVELTKIETFVQSRPILHSLHGILYHRYYIDTLYDWIVQYIVLNGICRLAQTFDTYVVDGLVNSMASLVTGLGNGMRRIETGHVQSYMIGFFGGVAVLALLAFALINVIK
jgi:NADH:ubiquinone oxidoreductase subunit 5 (subunit L)/multisubunit Na+/H+ antiporter MnhA subunit